MVRLFTLLGFLLCFALRADDFVPAPKDLSDVSPYVANIVQYADDHESSDDPFWTEWPKQFRSLPESIRKKTLDELAKNVTSNSPSVKSSRTHAASILASLTAMDISAILPQLREALKESHTDTYRMQSLAGILMGIGDSVSERYLKERYLDSKDAPVDARNAILSAFYDSPHQDLWKQYVQEQVQRFVDGDFDKEVLEKLFANPQYLYGFTRKHPQTMQAIAAKLGKQIVSTARTTKEKVEADYAPENFDYIEAAAAKLKRMAEVAVRLDSFLPQLQLTKVVFDNAFDPAVLPFRSLANEKRRLEEMVLDAIVYSDDPKLIVTQPKNLLNYAFKPKPAFTYEGTNITENDYVTKLHSAIGKVYRRPEGFSEFLNDAGSLGRTDPSLYPILSHMDVSDPKMSEFSYRDPLAA